MFEEYYVQCLYTQCLDGLKAEVHNIYGYT